jgi:hypothetical protein
VKYNGYLKVREFSYSRVIIWVNTILNHIDTKAVYLGMKILAWYTDPNDIKNKKISSNTQTLLVSKFVNTSLYIPKWYLETTIPVQDWLKHPYQAKTFQRIDRCVAHPHDLSNTIASSTVATKPDQWTNLSVGISSCPGRFFKDH